MINKFLFDKKGYLQISFGMIFGIIVGCAILFLAIFLATKIISTGETNLDAQTGKEIEILLNPLESSFETGKTTSMTLPVDSRIYTQCDAFQGFGRQIIRISQKSINKWTETDVNIGSSNKYIFTDSYVEGKTFYLFSKPFSFPFKVADLIYITSSNDKFCFIDPSDETKEEIESLQQQNILIDNCTADSKRICFESGTNCYAQVFSNYVLKDGEKLYFEGDALMFAAIFSDKETYECQVIRLMKRTGALALLYNDKASFISRIGCDSNLNLLSLNNGAENLDSSQKLTSLSTIAENIDTLNNQNSLCKLW